MKVILSEENEGINFFPFSLSIDWLNDQLYVLGEVTDKSGGTRWQITRCGLDGSGLTVAVAGLLTKPLHIEVDPYNGYLFWVIQENSKKGGLYRLDLADISNGIKHEITPVLILNHTDLGAFTVDHSNFRILVPSHSRNTVLAVSLDGHEINDIRNNTQSPQFQQVMSLATANGLFYWTNGKSILTEEYHSGQNSYFHNVLLQGPMFVRVNLPSSQPVPVPVNPPTGLQAVLGTGVARTTWTMPHLLGGQGKGAWQNWSYQLSLYDTGDNISQEIRNINTTSFVVHNLQPATVYILRAAAYTSAGVGPWSAPFRGKTLSAGGSKATILWSGAEGLLMSDPTGNTVHTLIDTESLKDIHGEQHISDITWYKDQLFLVTNSSSIYYYNLTEKRVSRIRDIDSVGSIAVDWIGKKLYWSNPKQQLITRGNLNGTQQEPLPILTVAKELNVDALHGYIYWSTGHAVECAHLNGKQRKTYYPAELFSGKQGT
ncbi:hypothetical protein AAG570_009094 [Ranatra chinensis]|uniref:Fibronectin type-III domain-containing protein n=1 Tax=Ranatra chinensis TaxID=642074 RepID=A0ABD0Z9U2_9HEMI